MPIRRTTTKSYISAELDNSEAIQSSIKISSKRKISFIAIWIMLIMILFVGDVVFESIKTINSKFQIEEAEAKKCMLSYLNSKCNPMNMTDECHVFYRCIQMEEI